MHTGGDHLVEFGVIDVRIESAQELTRIARVLVTLQRGRIAIGLAGRGDSATGKLLGNQAPRPCDSRLVTAALTASARIASAASSATLPLWCPLGVAEVLTVRLDPAVSSFTPASRERARVHKRGVPAPVLYDHRDDREPPHQDRRVPAAGASWCRRTGSPPPIAGRGGRRLGTDRRCDGLDRIHLQRHLSHERNAGAARMRVRIVEARRDALAAQVDTARSRAREREHLGCSCRWPTRGCPRPRAPRPRAHAHPSSGSCRCAGSNPGGCPSARRRQHSRSAP